MVRNATLNQKHWKPFWKEMFLVSVQLICYKSWHFTICCNIYSFYTLIYLFCFVNLKHSFCALAKYFVGSNRSLTCYLLLAEEREEPAEGLLYRQQESHLCQQMKLATVSQQGQESAAGWFQGETATCSTTQPCPGHYLRIKVSYKNMRRLDSTDNAHNSTVSDCARLLSFSSTLFLSDQQQYASNDQSKLPDPSRIRSRVPPNMPKLFIPSTVTKFPPEITVTPPTPTLLSPKGSISEETKQRLKVSTLNYHAYGSLLSQHSTVTPAVCSCTEHHPVVPVRSHSQKGHSDPAGTGGAGDIQPGVVSGERVGRGGRLHGHLSLGRPLNSWHIQAWLCQTPLPPILKSNNKKNRMFIPLQLSVLMLLSPHVHCKKKTKNPALPLQYSHRLSCRSVALVMMYMTDNDGFRLTACL